MAYRLVLFGNGKYPKNLLVFKLVPASLVPEVNLSATEGTDMLV